MHTNEHVIFRDIPGPRFLKKIRDWIGHEPDFSDYRSQFLSNVHAVTGAVSMVATAAAGVALIRYAPLDSQLVATYLGTGEAARWALAVGHPIVGGVKAAATLLGPFIAYGAVNHVFRKMLGQTGHNFPAPSP